MKSYFYILLDISGRHDYNLFLFYSPTQAKKRPNRKSQYFKTKTLWSTKCNKNILHSQQHVGYSALNSDTLHNFRLFDSATILNKLSNQNLLQLSNGDLFFEVACLQLQSELGACISFLKCFFSTIQSPSTFLFFMSGIQFLPSFLPFLLALLYEFNALFVYHIQT